MRKVCGILTALMFMALLCAAGAEDITMGKIRIPEGTEIPEDLQNPEDPVELGSGDEAGDGTQLLEHGFHICTE